jgi:hypothetical protein
VDIIGFDIYGNSGPNSTPTNNDYVQTDSDWNFYCKRGTIDNPWGPCQWAALARREGKQIGIAEWGVTNPGGTLATYADAPRYIQGMHDFFALYAKIMAYENYFNRLDSNTGDHRLIELTSTGYIQSTINPKASAKYKALWTP